jgi:3-phosphoshikimate 1-carboxyvinyltransferase
MNTCIVSPSHLCGRIVTPPSKSHTLRAILFATLAEGESRIRNYLVSADATSMINACRSFGATITVLQNDLVIKGIGGKVTYTEDVIDAGNSGIVLRFCSALGALATHPVVITGDASIRHTRPMKPLLEAFTQLNVSAESMRGDFFAPVIIKGPLSSGKIVLSGEDSQAVSALLIAAAFAQGPIDIEVKNPGEIPWIRLTLSWLDRLGISYSHENFTKYHVPGRSCCKSFSYTVPGDFSSAAFPIAAALITQSEIFIENIDMTDTQGDKELIHVFRKMGATIEIEKTILHVKKQTFPLHGITVDVNDFIDALPILSVVACFANSETVITNASIARHKECNRVACVATELRKMGASITENEDGLIIHPSHLVGGDVFSYHDHRMAMSLAVAALGAEKETTIHDVACVAKTFPSFFQDFKKLGANFKEVL